MGAVHHHNFCQSLLLQRLARLLDALLVEVRAGRAAAQDHEAVRVASSPRDGGKALLRDTHEVVLGGGSADGIDGDAERAVRAVLEAHWEGQA